jgi:hypothetical protein
MKTATMSIRLGSTLILICEILIHCTGTRVHSVIFIISLKLNIFPFRAPILTFSTQNHLILTYFTHFDTTHFFIGATSREGGSRYFTAVSDMETLHIRFWRTASVQISDQEVKMFEMTLSGSWGISSTCSQLSTEFNHFYFRFNILSLWSGLPVLFVNPIGQCL